MNKIEELEKKFDAQQKEFENQQKEFENQQKENQAKQEEQAKTIAMLQTKLESIETNSVSSILSSSHNSTLGGANLSSSTESKHLRKH